MQAESEEKMHLKDGELRAYQDQELRPDRYPQVKAHLASCAACQMRAEHLESLNREIDRQLATIQSDPDGGPVQTGVGRMRLTAALQTYQEKNTMKNKIFSRPLRPLWVGLTIVTVLAIALTFPQVRAAASSFLGLFRVQQIAVVQFNPQVMEGDQAATAQIDSLLSEDVKYEEIGQLQTVGSAVDASNTAGFAVRLPETALAGDLEVQPGGRATFLIDLPRLQALLAAVGKSDIQLPDELQGQTVMLEIPRGVTANFGTCQPPAMVEGQDPGMPVQPWQNACITLMQLPSPTISAPPGLDMAQLGQAYLQLLGMSEAEAAQYASTVDWTTTFVIPLPQYDTVYKQMVVDGVEGTLIQQTYDPEFGTYVLLWVKDGVVYSLTGAGDPSTGLEIANSLK